MTSLLHDAETLCFLLVEPDAGIAADVQHLLGDSDVHVEHVAGHLQALARSEDCAYDCVLVASRGIDISGLEMCTMLRAREARLPVPPLHVVMYGPQVDMDEVFSSAVHVDDCVIFPWSTGELRWKLERAVRVAHQRNRNQLFRHRDDATGLLTAKGLEHFLHEEVNRIGRRHGWFSLTVLAVTGLESLHVSYGQAWVDWLRTDVWAFLRRQLRNYDRLAIMDGDVLCLASPDLDDAGTRAQLDRLAGLIDCFAINAGAPAMHLGLSTSYLSVQVLGDYRQFESAAVSLWQWVVETVAAPLVPGIQGQSGTVALTLVLDSVVQGDQPKA